MNAEADDDLERIFQLDTYGLKGEFRFDLGVEDPPPQTVKELWSRVRQSLLSIAANSFGVVDDSLRAIRKFARGIGELPSALSQRISRAHTTVRRQESAELPKSIGRNRAASDVLDILRRMQEKGIPVQIKALPSGKVLICLGVRVDDETSHSVDETELPKLPPENPGL